MGDLADFLGSLGASKDMTNAITTAGTLISAASTPFAAYSAGKSVLQAIGVLPQGVSLDEIKNAIEALQQKLTSVLQQLDNEVLGIAQQQMRNNIYSVASQVRGWRDDAIHYAKTPAILNMLKCSRLRLQASGVR